MVHFVGLGQGELEDVGKPVWEVALDVLVADKLSAVELPEALPEVLLADAPKRLVCRRGGPVRARSPKDASQVREARTPPSPLPWTSGPGTAARTLLREGPRRRSWRGLCGRR